MQNSLFLCRRLTVKCYKRALPDGQSVTLMFERKKFFPDYIMLMTAVKTTLPIVKMSIIQMTIFVIFENVLLFFSFIEPSILCP